MSEETDEKSVLLCYGWFGKNRGDRSITLGMNELFSESSNNINYEIADWPFKKNSETSYDVSFGENYYKNYRDYLVRKYEDVPCRKFFYAIELVLLLCMPKTYSNIVSEEIGSQLKSIYEFDFILYNGGHLFLSNEKMSNYNILVDDILLILPGLLARRLNISYGLWAQSVGPVKNGVLFIDKLVLKGAEFIFCRESDSFEYLQKMGIKKEKINLIPDPAFMLPYEEDDHSLLDDYDINEYICLTVRRSGARRGVDIPNKVYSSYINELAEFVDRWIEQSNMSVVFVSQHGETNIADSANDSHVATILKQKINNSEEFFIVNEEITINELKHIYSNSAGLVGTRFHSLIFALQVGTPIIGISSYYTGPKISGMLKDLDLENGLFSMENLDSDTLYHQANSIFEQTQNSRVQSPSEIKSQSERRLTKAIQCAFNT